MISVTGLSCGNRPPYVPAALSGPTFCFKDTVSTFRTTATDPDGDSVSVRIMWTDLAASDWSDWFASGDTVVLTHAWPNAGVYKVYAQARDRGLNTSGWSDTLTVQVVTRYPPGIPLEPIGPEIGGQDTSYTFSTVASHPAGITVAVRFAWGDGATSDWSSFVASGETVALGHSWSAPGIYGVSAQAMDTGNVLSQWSTPHVVVVQPPVLKWRVQLGPGDLPSMSSSPAIGPDRIIYVGSNDSSLYAVNADGTIRWKYRTEGNVQSAPAIATDGTIYFGSDDDRLYALDPDGNVKWSYSTSGDVQSTPAIATDGTVYVGSEDNYAYAINPDGSLKWRYQTGGNVDASPAVAADGTIYFGSSSFFYALTPDGTIRWSHATHDDVLSSPAIGADGAVYFGCDSRTYFDFYAIGPDSTTKWALSGDRIRSAPAIGPDGSIYFGSSDDYLYALNPDSTLKWRYQTGSNVYSGPALSSDGTIYVGSSDGCLYALEPDGTLKWRYETGDIIRSSPAIGVDGTIYFTSEDGYLYALKGTSPLAVSPWPKFHHDLGNTGRVGGER